VTPVLHLLAHLSRNLMPIEVTGDVQWLVNKTTAGWTVTLLNPAGQVKPQQGILPADYRENRKVTIRLRVPVKSASDRLLPEDKINVVEKAGGGEVRLTVPAGGVRIIELR
jgi:hypothetical protein